MNLDALLKTMVKQEAADIYLIVGAPPSLSARGKLIRIGKENLTSDQIMEMANKLMRDDQKDEFEESLEQNLAYSLPGIGRFRVNIMKQRNSTAMTLAAMIDYRNNNKSGLIITIEDPLEFIHSHKKGIVTQREVGMDKKSYKNALKSALRQAPDVMLIGEIRDRETMDAAISFAETGHLVFSTLHSNNANQTPERILNFFPAAEHRQVYTQLSLNLRGIICQRLVKKSNDDGRVAVLEVMLGSPRIADLIHKGDTTGLKSVISASNHEGMQTFDQHLYELYKSEKVDYDTVIRAADSANDLKLRIRMEEGGDLETGELTLESA